MNTKIIVYSISIFIIVAVIGFTIYSVNSGGSGGGGDTQCERGINGKCPDGLVCDWENTGQCVSAEGGKCTNDSDCNNGKCGSNNKCICNSPYIGEFCNKICKSGDNTCKNGGVCNDEGICNCPSGYYPPDCKQKIDIPCSQTCNPRGGKCDISGICQCFNDDQNGYWKSSPNKPNSCNVCNTNYQGTDCKSSNIKINYGDKFLLARPNSVGNYVISCGNLNNCRSTICSNSLGILSNQNIIDTVCGNGIVTIVPFDTNPDASKGQPVLTGQKIALQFVTSGKYLQSCGRVNNDSPIMVILRNNLRSLEIYNDTKETKNNFIYVNDKFFIKDGDQYMGDYDFSDIPSCMCKGTSLAMYDSYSSSTCTFSLIPLNNICKK